MAIRAGFVGAVLLIPLFVGGCYRGYKSAEDLESEDRGPTACQKSCAQLGMHMSAFVLVEHTTSGCVCAPNQPPPGYPPPMPRRMPAGPAPQGAPPSPPAAPAGTPPAATPPASSQAPASPPPGPESQSEQGSAATAAAYVVIQAQRQAARRTAGQNQPVNYNHP
jgi:hypothetical protein